MKILIIGGTGTIGKKVAAHFSKDHEVIRAGLTTGDINIDISDSISIEKALEKVGKLDALISTAGKAKWAPFDEMKISDYELGINNKLMGQVNLVRIGRKYLHKSGSITLTTGILGDDPVVQTTGAAMVNGAIHSFVKAVALELRNNIRVNVVSPGLVEDSAEKYRDYFPGYNPIPMEKVINGYVRSVRGKDNGQVIRIY